MSGDLLTLVKSDAFKFTGAELFEMYNKLFYHSYILTSQRTRDLADGLLFLHEKGIIHRDLALSR